MSKKEGKIIARKSQPRSQFLKTCISSPNVAIPTNCSSFYQEYIDKLELNSSLLKDRLTVQNYKEKFHHLLCWEEQEHIRQLSERYICSYSIFSPNDIYFVSGVIKNMMFTYLRTISYLKNFKMKMNVIMKISTFDLVI